MQYTLGPRVPVALAPTAAQLQRLGALVREERQRRGWTIRDLHARSGVNEGTISRVERGRPAPHTGAGPTEDTLFALAHTLNIPVETLIAAIHWLDPEPKEAGPEAGAFARLFGGPGGG